MGDCSESRSLKLYIVVLSLSLYGRDIGIEVQDVVSYLYLNSSAVVTARWINLSPDQETFLFSFPVSLKYSPQLKLTEPFCRFL